MSRARPKASAVAFNANVRVKLLSMGEGGVGKSCLIKRYCEKKFVSRYISTIGVDFGVKNVKIDGQDISINFWDLSGHPEFFEVRNEFYRDTQGVLLVYDVGSRRSFEKLEAWLAESNRFGSNPTLVAVCANKVDLTDRVVSQQEGSEWAVQKGFQYFETSAKSGENVNEAFLYLLSGVVSKTNGTPGKRMSSTASRASAAVHAT